MSLVRFHFNAEGCVPNGACMPKHMRSPNIRMAYQHKWMIYAWPTTTNVVGTVQSQKGTFVVMQPLAYDNNPDSIFLFSRQHDTRQSDINMRGLTTKVSTLY